MKCNVCDNSLDHILYESVGENSISSLGELVSGKTTVFYCDHCNHIQTREIQQIEEYYSSQYKILVESDEEDQIISSKTSHNTFRFDFQTELFLKHCEIEDGENVLEYGSAKAATLKKIAATHRGVNCFAYDVSNMYLPFWDKFLDKNHQATYQTPQSWQGKMDYIISYYVLEHVADLQTVVANINSLLKEGGVFYFIVPNVFGNVADLIVCDHCNHFTRSSIECLLLNNGFAIDFIDSESHAPAFVVKATKSSRQTQTHPPGIDDECLVEAKKLAAYWQKLDTGIRTAASSYKSPLAVYGAGVYGRYIATKLNGLDCFIDQNPYLQGKTALGIPVVSPDNIPAGINTIYIGLNPAQARSIIAQNPSINGEEYELVFLEDIK